MLPPSVFIVLILVALIAAFVAVPLISFVGLYFGAHRGVGRRRIYIRPTSKVFGILLSFKHTKGKRVVLSITRRVFTHKGGGLSLATLRLAIKSSIGPLRASGFRRIDFKPVLCKTGGLNVRVRAHCRISGGTKRSVYSVIGGRKFSFLLINSNVSVDSSPSSVTTAHCHASFCGHCFGHFGTPRS